MKKLIYVLNSYGNSDSSHFSHILHLLEVMAQMGCEIQLIVEKAEDLPVFKSSNIVVTALKSKTPIVRHVQLFFKIKRLIKSGYKRTFVRIAASASIVSSIANRAYGGQSYLWQSGTTHEHDNGQPMSFKKLKWTFSSRMPNFLARSITHRFVTGPEAMVDYYEKIVKVKRSKIDLLYNDIQLERFKILNRNDKRASFDIEHGLNPNARVLLLVHRLSPVRRTLLYLEALLRNLDEKLHRDSWFFVIAGGGSELKGAKELAASLGLTNSIHFLGDVPNVLVPDVYAIADVFVNPTYTEGFPRVIIEAMASGLPIVTTDAGGTEQLLGDLQQHYVVDKADYELFANKTLELLTNPAQWDRLAKENLVQVERFSTPEVARMYIRTLFQ